MTGPGIPTEPVFSEVPLRACPITASLGVLGKKWALIVLRDLAFFQRHRFSDMLRHNEDLTPRVLSRRLKEMTKDGLIARRPNSQGGNEVFYSLTPKGRDAIPILSAYLQYGAKHHPKVFKDARSHTLDEMYPGKQAFILGGLQDYALRKSPIER